MDDRGQHGVGQLYLIEYGRGLLREKAAVVGRQADGGVARVDLAAERGDVVEVVVGDGGKGVAGGRCVCRCRRERIYAVRSRRSGCR